MTPKTNSRQAPRQATVRSGQTRSAPRGAAGRRIILTTVTAVGALALIGCGETTSPRAGTSAARARVDSVQWGAPVNGLQVGMFAAPGHPGDTAIGLFCAVRNISNEPIELMDLSARATAWGDSPPVMIEADGQRLLRDGSGEVEPSTLVYVILQPGENRQVPTRLAMTHFDAQPGQQLRLTLILQGGSPEMALDQPTRQRTSDGQLVRRWFGEARSGTVDVVLR